MKIPASTHLLAFSLLVAVLLPNLGDAYDSPDFDAEVFQTDGLFLPENDRDSLVEALAALASNFPANPKIDSDLKEKAIGIALRIDPMHFNSRNAHDALNRGTIPRETNFFKSLSGISELLWNTSTSLLANPAEPEQVRLAPYLMELSLLAHPAPSDDRLLRFASVTQGEKNPWDKFLILDADDNPSTRRAEMFFLEIKKVQEKQKNRNSPKDSPSIFSQKPTQTRPGPSTTGPSVASKQPKAKPKSNPLTTPLDPFPWKPVRLSIPTVRQVKTVEGKTAGGEFALHIRKPAGKVETELFPFLENNKPPPYPQLPLFSGKSGILMTNFEITAPQANSRGWEWPRGMVGEIHFDTDDPLPGPRRLCRSEGRLPSLILLDSALLEKPLNPSFTLTGDLGELGLTSELDGDPVETVVAAAKLGRPFTLFPESGLSALVEGLDSVEELKSLFATELVSFSNYDEASSAFINGTDPALLEASKAFSEIESASDRMPLLDFLRNEIVQERLNGILEIYPRHLSAKAMLAFGKKPIPKGDMLETDISKIDSLIDPIFELRDSEADLNQLRNGLDDIELGVSRLRTEIVAGARDYHSKAIDLIEAAEVYLQLTNRTTSIAEQRRRELLQALDDLDSERDLIGIPRR